MLRSKEKLPAGEGFLRRKRRERIRVVGDGPGGKKG